MISEESQRYRPGNLERKDCKQMMEETGSTNEGCMCDMKDCTMLKVRDIIYCGSLEANITFMSKRDMP
jgi:hypothetical protein